MFNIALIGAGRIGQVHAKNIANHESTRLLSVVEPYDVNADLICQQYGANRQSLEQVMQDQNIDAVCICSATNTHAEIIELAAKAGKAIFCEKPVDLDLSRVRDCLSIVKKYDAPLLMGFNRRFDPQFSSLKRQFDQGKIGRASTLSIISRDPEPPSAEYVKVSGGMFRDMSIHDFDMARFILGEDPVSVYATGGCMVDPEIGKAGDIDTAVVVMHFPSGAIATIQNSRRSGYGYDQRIELHGDTGSLQVTNRNENHVVHLAGEGVVSAKPMHFFLERYKDAYVAEWQHFVDILHGQDSNCSGVDGEMALRIADAALESLNTGLCVKL
ncbi:inositol 2-dehydrogenase [Vibrio sp. S4M6]|uniref:inositol 2-dehydrogenase n=1 Tax=Vibrio sinus TaxID=2946865 RepID=UPI00202A7EBE|nr:inositol 2-dehydrogenase [Vibrio sinus]MCL9780761.1 inositol 2-dehydrogenase [Vibrio sinus]